jgi:hypothetical protein
LATDLGFLEKPSVYSIEAVLLKARGYIYMDPNLPESTLTLEEKKVEKVEKTKINLDDVDRKEDAKALPIDEIEIDGVKFSSKENLTTLDKKIELQQETYEKTESVNEIDVELDKSKVPITEQEFVTLLLDRLKK